MVCANVPTCGASLGKTYGTPQIRRFHNGQPWGAVFGNGLGSYNGDAGIFVMLATSTGGASPRRFLLPEHGLRHRTTLPNGIEDATPADLDGDHIIDYVYAGDILGNVWRFDLTSQNPSNWTVTQVGGVPTPIYSVQTGTPVGSLTDHQQGDRRLHRLDPDPPHPDRVRHGSSDHSPTRARDLRDHPAISHRRVGLEHGAWDCTSAYQYDAVTVRPRRWRPRRAVCPRPSRADPARRADRLLVRSERRRQQRLDLDHRRRRTTGP